MSIYNEIGRRKIDPVALDGITNAGPTSGLWVAAAGDVVVVLVDDPLSVSTTFASVPAGTWLPICIKSYISGPAGTVAVAS